MALLQPTQLPSHLRHPRTPSPPVLSQPRLLTRFLSFVLNQIVQGKFSASPSSGSVHVSILRPAFFNTRPCTPPYFLFSSILHPISLLLQHLASLTHCITSISHDLCFLPASRLTSLHYFFNILLHLTPSSYHPTLHFSSNTSSTLSPCHILIQLHLVKPSTLY